MDFTNRVALITGSSRGLGLAYAKQLSKLGATVVLNGTSKECETLAEQFRCSGRKALALRGDISSESTCRELVESAIATYGKIDILINNAGNRADTALKVPDIQLSDLRRIISVHLESYFMMSMAIWPHMEREQYGRIINTCSNLVFGAPGRSHTLPHATAKAGIIGLTKGLANEGRSINIKVNGIFPVGLLSPPSNPSRTSSRGVEIALAEAARRKPEAAENIATSVAYLAHETLDFTGELFSICDTRVARVFLGESAGCFFGRRDLEDVSKAFQQSLCNQEIYRPDTLGETMLSLGVHP